MEKILLEVYLKEIWVKMQFMKGAEKRSEKFYLILTHFTIPRVSFELFI